MADTVSTKHSNSSEEAPAAPDSTTSMFVEGEDVLVDRHHTGRFFMGTIVQIDQATERCLLRFLDNQECWAHLNELQHMKDDPAERLCVICKKTGKNVFPCPKCGRGYHKACQQPTLVEGIVGSKWVCRWCGDTPTAKKRTRQSNELSLSEQVLVSAKSQLTSIGQKHPAPSSALSQTSSLTQSNPVRSILKSSLPCTSGSQKSVPIHQLPSRKQKLPYDISSLSWDELRLINDEQCYCYCAQSGDWFLQMLQCVQCRQWFHQDCLTCLFYPLYCGDRSYIFLCSICNGGQEFLRRVEMKWVDVVHLSIFNLMLFTGKKYFAVDKDILPYVVKNWFFMQLPPKMFKCRETDVKEIISRTLRGNSLRFKCGREIKMRTTIWGLRVRMPPVQPDIIIPDGRPMTETILFNSNPVLKCIPCLSSMHLMKGKAVLHPDGKMYPFNYQLMVGGPHSWYTSHSLREAARGLHLLDTNAPSSHSQPRVPVNGEKVCVKSVENCGGYAKKSSAYRAPNRLTLQESLLRHNVKSSKRQETKELPRKRKSTRKCASSREESDSQDSQASYLSQDETSNDDDESDYAVSEGEEEEEETEETEETVDETSRDGVTSQDGQTTYSSSQGVESSSDGESTTEEVISSSETCEDEEDEDWSAKPRTLRQRARILRQNLEDTDEDQPLQLRRRQQRGNEVEQESNKSDTVYKRGKDVIKLQKPKPVSELKQECETEREIVMEFDLVLDNQVVQEGELQELPKQEIVSEEVLQYEAVSRLEKEIVKEEVLQHEEVSRLEKRIVSQEVLHQNGLSGQERVHEQTFDPDAEQECQQQSVLEHKPAIAEDHNYGQFLKSVDQEHQELVQEQELSYELDQELTRELEHVNQRVREQEFERELSQDQVPQKMPEAESSLLLEEENESLPLVLTPPPSGTPNTPQPTVSPKLVLANLCVNSTTPADTEAEDESPVLPEPHITTFRSISELLGGPIVTEPKPSARLIPCLPPLTPVITEPPPARTIKRKLSEKDIKIVNGVVKRKRMRRSHSHVGTKTVQLDSGEKIEKRIVGGRLLRSPHKPNVTVPEPEPCAVEVAQPCSDVPSTTAPPQRLEVSISDIKKSVSAYFSAGNRIAAGEKYRIIGKRTTALGTEYLIEWDYPPL